MTVQNIPDAIRTHGLSKDYGRVMGISQLNLSIQQGEIFGFLGPNGAGKTTTIRLLLGLIRPSSGEIFILGKDNKHHRRDISNSVGYLPGDLGLYRDLSGCDYLRHFMKLRSSGLSIRASGRLDDLMARFDIPFDKKISTCSKGMRQMIGIIQAFMHEPRVVILDEPTHGLDPIMQEHFYQFLREEKEAGKTIFFSSHILSEVEKICDRVGIIKQGKLVHAMEIGRYRSNVLKKVSIVPGGEMLRSASLLQGLAGVKDTVIENERIEFLYAGNMQVLVQCIAGMEIKDLVCEPPTLEEAFYEYYAG